MIKFFKIGVTSKGYRRFKCTACGTLWDAGEEHFKHVPNIIALIKYAMYFGVSTDYLLGMDEQDNDDKYRSYQAMIMVWADRAARGRYDGNDELVRDVIAFAKAYGLARKDKER